MTNETNNKEEDIKKIGHFQIRFITSFNSKKSDFLTLKILITPDLKDFIKKNVVINEYENFLHNNGKEIEHVKRYKVKSIWYSCLTSLREYIFNVELINNGQTEYKFYDKSILENLIDYTKDNFHLLIKNVLKYNNLDFTITYN